MADMTQELWGLLGTSFWEVSGQMVLGKNLRFWTVGLISFLCAQLTGIAVFMALLERRVQKTGAAWGGRWLRFFAGAMTGELIEAVIFMTLMLAPDWDTLRLGLWGQLAARGAITLMELPVYYLLTWRKHTKWRKITHV